MADIVVEAIDEERFLILTHPEVVDTAGLRATDPADYLASTSAVRKP